MTADAGTLKTHYHDLAEAGARREGTWYVATLSDRSPAMVLALSKDVAARLANPDLAFAELAMAATVRHDGIAAPKAWGALEDGTIHVAFAREGDFALMAPGQKPVAEVAAVGVHLARALQAVHATGLVHGAVSTSRLVRAGRRGVQLGSFGVFPALRAGGLGIRDAAALLSDVPYVSPEARVGSALTERSDVFSLGATLYELITGKAPFGGRTTSYVMASVLSEDSAPADAEQPTGPAVDAVLRAIERAPEDRWPTAAAFASALAAGTDAAVEPEETSDGKRESLLRIFKGAWFPARRSRE